jgi:hypothetical protein
MMNNHLRIIDEAIRHPTESEDPVVTANVLARLQMLGNSHNIKGFAFGNQGANGFEHQTVIVTIEICGADCVGDLIPCGGIEKQTAQDGLLCFDRVRRHAQRIDLIDRALSESLGTGHCVRSAYRYPCC